MAQPATNSATLETPDAPLSWAPQVSRAGWQALTLAAALLIIGALATFFAVQQPIGLGMFLGLLLGVICALAASSLGILAYGCLFLRYRMEPNALVIRWVDREERLPYGQIDGILGGSRLGAVRVRGFNWPGYWVGIGRSRTLGTVRFYATSLNPEHLILVLTPTGTLALSPANLDEFRQQLIGFAERSQGSAAGLPPTVRPGLPAVARDIAARWSAALSLVILAAMVGWIMVRFGSLPDQIPLHFDAAASPDMVTGKMDVFRFPAIGAVILLINFWLGSVLYNRERLASRLLWGATALIQLIIFIAVARILTA